MLSEQTDDLSEDALKSRILNTALMYVPVHGWSVKSLQMAVEKEGFPAVSHGMFPRFVHFSTVTECFRFLCMFFAHYKTMLRQL